MTLFVYILSVSPKCLAKNLATPSSSLVYSVVYFVFAIMIIECRNDYFRFDKPILSAFA